MPPRRPTRYVALLRGINVGGRNLIPMPALRARFEAEGCAGVSTYIQSGNVLFTSGERSAALAARLAAALSRAFRYEASLVLRSAAELRAVVEGAPPGFGARPAAYRYDVLFLMPPLGAREALAEVRPREGVDEATAGDGVLYFSRLAARASQSRLSRITASPIYPRLTIRNWNTTTRLLALVTADGPGGAP